MAGSISSLGIGSGVLTADVIDKLKEADKSAVINPLDKKIDLNKQKQDAYSLLSSLMTTFKASASALSDDILFENKSVDVSGDAAVSLDLGVNIDSFTLETINLAKKDITQFGSVASRDTQGVTGGSGILDINGTKIEYKASMTLGDLAQAITEAGGDKFSASILKTGEGAFSLVVSSKETGTANALTITDETGNLATTLMDPTKGYNKVQPAEDAVFKYNGIEMTRSSNTITDIAVGLNITLKKQGDFSNVDINLDKSAITDEIDNFVEAYNALISNLNDMTTVNQETGTEGVFNNESFIKSISRELTQVITSLHSDGKSLVNFGIDINERGTMSFQKSVLEAALESEPLKIKEFFTGSYDKDFNQTNGIFDTINAKLESYTGSGKLLSNYESSLETEAKNLAQSRTAALESLSARYDTMSARFAAYDAIISKINTQFSSLQMMITSELNGK